MTPLISGSHLGKRYGDITALDDLSITVERGSIVGLLGPNGAGKSTLLSLLMGVRRPTSGTLNVLGGNPRYRSVRERLGVTPQESSLPEALSVSETIDLVSAHFRDSVDRDELIEAFDLSGFLSRRCSALSGGQRRRLAVALAFVGNSELVLLDEPTTGLDLESRRLMWDSILTRHATGTTIIITSHYLEEIEALAERVVVIDKGRVIADDATLNLIGTFATKSVTLTTKDIISLRSLPSLIGAPKVGKDNEVSLRTNDSDELIREIVRSEIPFSELRVDRASLEDAFIAITKGSEHEAEVQDA
ncbi:ABC transporter ATP-binding protein [Actinopolyspora mortivallis]|uniref:ABC transporter ATP-binding protein n=1 Tax=Actinopolyspora mortivallis TaxID=33906 RepID=UPI000380184B|nr:ABC transporter ATP-binding protein [Actinopolyspora mortivallis]